MFVELTTASWPKNNEIKPGAVASFLIDAIEQVADWGTETMPPSCFLCLKGTADGISVMGTQVEVVEKIKSAAVHWGDDRFHDRLYDMEQFIGNNYQVQCAIKQIIAESLSQASRM